MTDLKLLQAVLEPKREVWTGVRNQARRLRPCLNLLVSTGPPPNACSLPCLC